MEEECKNTSNNNSPIIPKAVNNISPTVPNINTDINPEIIKKKSVQIKDDANSTSNRGKNEIFSKAQLRPLIQNKILFLSNLHDFFYNLSNNIYLLITKVNTFTIKKLENTLDQNKNFLKFFKDTMSCYERFSVDLLKSKAILSISIKEEKLIFNEINSMIDKSQESLASNFLTFSTILHQNIVLKGPFTKIQSFYKRMKVITKNISEDLARLSSKNERLFNKNKINQTIFENFSISQGNDVFSNFLSKNDLFLMEVNYTKTVNKIIEIIKILLRNYIGYFSDMKLIIFDYLTLMKDTIEIYLNANKKVFTDAANIESIQSAFNNITKESIEINFTPAVFFKELLKEVNEFLKEFQAKIIKHNFIKADSAYIDSNYNFESHKTLCDFVNFIIDILPERYEIDHSNLITYMTVVKRDPGLFQAWRSSILLTTVQNNLYFFDKRIQKNYSEKIYLKNLNCKEKKDKKSEFRLELKESKKGFKSNVVVLMEACSKENFDHLKNLFLHFEKQNKNINSAGDNKKVENNVNNLNTD